MPDHTPDTFAPEPMQETCDPGSVINTLFGIARQHMSRDELAQLSEAGEHAETALQNLEAIASVIGIYLEGGGHSGKRFPVSDLFFFLSDEMRVIRALMNVGAAAKGG
jgi:hypothetical protein